MFRTFLNKFDRQSTVKTKLVVSFGLILFFTIIVGGISIYGYYVMGKSADWLYVQGARGIEESKQLQIEAAAFDIEVNHLLLSSTLTNKAEGQALRERAIANIEKLRTNLEKSLKVIEGNIIRSKTRVEFNELVEDFDIYLIAIEQIILLEKGSPSTATSMYFSDKFQGYQPRINKDLQDFVDAKLESAKLFHQES